MSDVLNETFGAVMMNEFKSNRKSRAKLVHWFVSNGTGTTTETLSKLFGRVLLKTLDNESTMKLLWDQVYSDEMLQRSHGITVTEEDKVVIEDLIEKGKAVYDDSETELALAAVMEKIEAAKAKVPNYEVMLQNVQDVFESDVSLEWTVGELVDTVACKAQWIRKIIKVLLHRNLIYQSGKVGKAFCYQAVN